MSRDKYAVNRYNEEYYWTFYRLSQDYESPIKNTVTGGSVEFSDHSDVKYSGRISTDGGAQEFHTFIRVHHAFDTAEHGHVDDLLGTFVVSDVTETIDGTGLSERTATLYSLLRIPQTRLISSPLTIRKGTRIIEKAQSMIDSLGLDVYESAFPPDTALKEDVVYDPGESYLGIVNDLLGRVGWHIGTRANGDIIFTPDGTYDEASSVTWRDDADSVMMKDITIENNSGDRANVIRGHGSTAETNFWVVARNNDDGCAASLARRQGIEVSEMLDLGTIEWEYDGTIGGEIELSSSIGDAAAAALTKAATEIKHVKIKAASGAAKVGDTLRVVLDGGGIDETGRIVNVSMTLEPGATADYQMRSVYVPDESKYSVTTGVY